MKVTRQIIQVNCCTVSIDQQKSLQNFWKLEEAEYKDKILSKDEQFCEDRFAKTTNYLDSSEETAINRFHSMERKLIRDHNLITEYILIIFVIILWLII